MTILYLICFVAFVMMVWLQTNALADYALLTRSVWLFKVLKLKEYNDALQEAVALGVYKEKFYYPYFIAELYPTAFLHKLVTCPLCLACWLCLPSFFLLPFGCYFVVVCGSWLLYGILVIIYNQAYGN